MRPALRRSLARGFTPTEDNVEPDHGASLFGGKPGPASGLERGPDRITRTGDPANMLPSEKRAMAERSRRRSQAHASPWGQYNRSGRENA